MQHYLLLKAKASKAEGKAGKAETIL